MTVGKVGSATVESLFKEIQQAEEGGTDTTPISESCSVKTGMAIAFGAACGAITGLIHVSMYPDPYQYDTRGRKFKMDLGVRHVLHTMKGPVAASAVVCGVFRGVECVMGNLREEQGSAYLNSAVAGATCGLLMGSVSKRFGLMVGSAIGVGLVMGMVAFNGPVNIRDPEKVDRKWNSLLLQQDEREVDKLKEQYPEWKHV